MIEPTGGAEIGEHRLPGSGEPAAETMGNKDAGKQDGEAQQARDLDPVRRDKGQKRRAIRRPPTMATTTALLMPGASGGSATRMAATAAGGITPSASHRARSASRRCR
jgi:hypothetical protein